MQASRPFTPPSPAPTRVEPSIGHERAATPSSHPLVESPGAVPPVPLALPEPFADGADSGPGSVGAKEGSDDAGKGATGADEPEGSSKAAEGSPRRPSLAPSPRRQPGLAKHVSFNLPGSEDDKVRTRI